MGPAHDAAASASGKPQRTQLGMGSPLGADAEAHAAALAPTLWNPQGAPTQASDVAPPPESARRPKTPYSGPGPSRPGEAGVWLSRWTSMKALARPMPILST